MASFEFQGVRRGVGSPVVVDAVTRCERNKGVSRFRLVVVLARAGQRSAYTLTNRRHMTRRPGQPPGRVGLRVNTGRVLVEGRLRRGALRSPHPTRRGAATRSSPPGGDELRAFFSGRFIARFSDHRVSLGRAFSESLRLWAEFVTPCEAVPGLLLNEGAHAGTSDFSVMVFNT